MPLWKYLAQAMWPWSRTCPNLFLVLWASVCHRVCHIMFIMDGSFSAVLKCIKQWMAVEFLTPKSEALQRWLGRIGLFWCRCCEHENYAVGWEKQGIMAKIWVWTTSRGLEDRSLETGLKLWSKRWTGILMWQVQPVALCVMLVNKSKSKALTELIKTVPEL